MQETGVNHVAGRIGIHQECEVATHREGLDSYSCYRLFFDPDAPDLDAEPTLAL